MTETDRSSSGVEITVDTESETIVDTIDSIEEKQEEWTTIGITEYDKVLIDTAKDEVDRNDDSYREFVMFLLNEHPLIDYDAIRLGTINYFTQNVGGSNE